MSNPIEQRLKNININEISEKELAEVRSKFNDNFLACCLDLVQTPISQRRKGN